MSEVYIISLRLGSIEKDEVNFMGSNLSKQDIYLLTESIRGLSEEVKDLSSELVELKTMLKPIPNMEIKITDLRPLGIA